MDELSSEVKSLPQTKTGAYLKERAEIQLLKAKIKGYHALEKLFQESKSQNKALLAANAQLKRKLVENTPSTDIHDPWTSESMSSLTERKLLVNDKVCSASQSSGHVSVASEHNELDVEEMNISEVEIPSATGTKSKMPETKHGYQSGDGLQSLEIDPYDLNVENSKFAGAQAFPNDEKASQTRKQDLKPSPKIPRSLSDSIVLISPESWGNGQLIAQVRQISEVLSRNVGLQSPSELSDALARLSINVLKVEKQLLLKQEMINNLSPENEQLRDHLEAKVKDREEVIEILRREKEEMEMRIMQLEKSVMESPDREKSFEWIQIGSPTQRKINDINSRWEARARDLESVHNSQVKQLQSHLSDCRSRLAASEELDKKRQADIDKLLLVAKRRTEDEKHAKMEVHKKLCLEEERRHEVETKLLTERRRADVLRDQVAALESQLSAFSDSRLVSLTAQQQNPSLSGLSHGDLHTDMQILRQQVTIFKEDFDKERSDRERVQGERDALQNALARFKADLTTAQQKIRHLEQERGMLTSENNHLRQEFQQIHQGDQDLAWLQNENRQLKEQLRQKIVENQHLKTRPSGATSPQDSPWSEVPGPASGKWTCSVCTFDNPGIRSTCEVCGRSRTRSQNSSGSNRLIPHSPVRGWTECDTERGPIKFTSGDDLIIDQAEDQPDGEKK